MELYIAEKPSLARTIAKNLPGKKTEPRGAGYIETDQGVVVTWAVGHIYELAPPKYYTPNAFSFSALPIIPNPWKVLPKAETKDQVNIIKSLIAKATTIVNAGDPDREGQLIVDEMLADCKVTVPVKRLWLHGMDEVTVKRAIASLKDNKDYESMGRAALARGKADWLVGMNLSPAYTLAAQKNGFSGTLSVGRVQTPTLGMVVARDLEIENFIPKDYFVINVDSKVAQGNFLAKLRVPKGIDGVDSEGRITSQALADQIVRRVQSAKGQITKYETKKASELAPLPYSQSSLVIAASSKYGYGAQMVLDITQSLYEKHELTTYPRTDNEYLPETYTADVNTIMGHLANNFPIAAKGNKAQKGRVFNDAKVGAHHALIPTSKQANMSLLSQAEKNIYEMICLRYIAQFFPDYVYNKTSVEVTYGPDVFTATGRVDVSQGWRDVLPKSAAKADDEEDVKLPAMTLGEPASPIKVFSEAKKTKPPPAYTEGTLVEAMTNVHLVVTDPQIKKRLKEVAGLGTEATRASIIQTLFKREFIVSEGKKLKSTPTGRALIKVLPNTIVDPGMTALWEAELEGIAEGKKDPEAFLQMQTRALVTIVEAARDLKITVPSVKSKSAAAVPESMSECPKCNKSMRAIKSKTGKLFYGCTGYPNCDHTAWPEEKKKSFSKSKSTSSKTSTSKSTSKARFSKSANSNYAPAK